MVKINKNYNALKESYLFSTTARKIREFQAANPDKPVIKMGIGDVTKPLTPCVVSALEKASAEMGVAETFRGYGDEQGYAFLRNAVQKYYEKIGGVKLDADEIFISDGAKSDIANFTDLFSNENVIIIPDPVYPVYLDSNVMLGREIVYIEGNVLFIGLINNLCDLTVICKDTMSNHSSVTHITKSFIDHIVSTYNIIDPSAVSYRIIAFKCRISILLEFGNIVNCNYEIGRCAAFDSF